MRYKILVITLLLGGLAIVAVSVSLGIMKRDIQVESSPYEAGLRYDETMRRYTELGWKVDMPESLNVGDRILRIRLLDRNEVPIENATVGCLITECAGTEERRATCSNTADGYYKCPVDLVGPGCRDVRVNVSKGADNMVFDRKLIVERRQEG